MSESGRCLKCGGWIWECRAVPDGCIKHLRERVEDLEFRIKRIEDGGRSSGVVK